MQDRIDRILAVLDVGDQHTTPGHGGFSTQPRPGDIDYDGEATLILPDEPELWIPT